MYGNMDEELNVEVDLPLLEKNWEYYHIKDSSDEKAMLWAVFTTFSKEYSYFIFGRLIMVMFEMLEPMLIMNFTKFIQSGQETTQDEMIQGIACVFALFFMRVIRHIFNENLVYDQIVAGHRSTAILKSLVYKKHYKMS